jgi:hypothetical protein
MSGAIEAARESGTGDDPDGLDRVVVERRARLRQA